MSDHPDNAPARSDREARPMSREQPLPPALHFRIEPADRRALERIARHERTTVSQLLRKMVADWLRSQQQEKRA
jgi:hypothetical protein